MRFSVGKSLTARNRSFAVSSGSASWAKPEDQLSFLPNRHWENMKPLCTALKHTEQPWNRPHACRMLIAPHFIHSHNTASPHQNQNSKWQNYSQSEHIQCLYKYMWNDFTVGEATSAMRQHSNVASEKLQKSHIDYFCGDIFVHAGAWQYTNYIFIGKKSAQIFSLMVYALQKKKRIFASRY